MKINNAKMSGEAVKEQRKKLGYTQKYICEVSGISASYISDLENGKETIELGKAIYLANLLGIEIPESFIINIGKGTDSEVLFATKRYDRREESDKNIDGLSVPFRLHQEDFAQAMGIPASEKYEREKRGYLRRMFDVIRELALNPIAEQTELWKRIIPFYTAAI